MIAGSRSPEKPSIQECFERFDAAHPDVYVLFRRFALQLLRAGRRRYSADAILHRVRWHYATSSGGGEDFKINNNFVSRYARKLIRKRPEFRDFFETRRLRTN